MLFQKYFLRSLLIFLIIRTAFHYSGSSAFKYLLTTGELLLIFYALHLVLQKGKKAFNQIIYISLFILSVAVTSILNERIKIDDALKLFGSIVIFVATLLSGNRVIFQKTKESQIMVIIIAMLPLLVFCVDLAIGFKESFKSMAIFTNSNNYIFYVICSVWLMMVNKISHRIIWSYFLISFFITSTLGAVLAVLLSLCFYYRKQVFNLRYSIGFVIIGLIGFYLLTYSDIYIFERIRGSGEVFIALFEKNSLKHLSEIGFEEAIALSNSGDGGDVSFLFRIKIWTEILTYYLNQDLIFFLFGLGLGSVPELNSFGLVAHNDYLSWIIEMGLIGATLIIFGVWYGFKELYKTHYIIPYLAILIYLFTENLYFNFFGDILVMYCLALSIKEIRVKTAINLQLNRRYNESITN